MWFRIFVVLLVLVIAIAILDILTPGDDDASIPNNPTQTQKDNYEDYND